MSKPTRSLPAPLERAVRRFGSWRKTRTKRAIPDSLWTLATKLGAKYGVNRTASALRLDYYDLRRRVDAVADAPEAAQTFVEVVPTAVSPGSSSTCLVELEDARGAKMRIQLESAGIRELSALGELFWRREG